MKKYIAIDGKGGSGKTHLSIVLGKALHATVFHLDDYGNDFEPFIGIPALVNAIDTIEGEVVIYEGVGVFDNRFDQLNALKVFTNPPDEVRASRLSKRDVPRPGRSLSDWEKIGKIWSKAESEYFSENLKSKADITVDTINTNSDVVTILKLFV